MATSTVIRRRSNLCSATAEVQLLTCIRRYVAKIIFTYILGYKVDVGHMEAVNLISSPKYSEKQIVRHILTSLVPCSMDAFEGIPGRDAPHAREL